MVFRKLEKPNKFSDICEWDELTTLGKLVAFIVKLRLGYYIVLFFEKIILKAR